MLRSMTGFGRGDYVDETVEIQIEIKTVNHRYSDVNIRMPRQLSFFEDRIREMVLKSISRGKIELFISYNDRSEDAKNVLLDEGLAKAYIQSVGVLRDKYGLKDDISVSLISRFPEVLKIERSEDDEDKLWAALKQAIEKSLNSLMAMREKEGDVLRQKLMERMDAMADMLKDIEKRAPEVVAEYKQRLENRIKELTGQTTVDENRLALEVAIFADRCSIDEEIVRLWSHIGQFKAAFSQDQPVGRKLDFIIQEMNREINTIGSKANNTTVINHVVGIKSELEKMREQIQNTE